MCDPPTSPSKKSNNNDNEVEKSSSCFERFGDVIEGGIQSFFSRIGRLVALYPWRTIGLAGIVTLLCMIGFLRWTTENRGEELWVPQNTAAERETDLWNSLYPRTVRFNTIIVTTPQDNNNADDDNNILTKPRLMEAIRMHQELENNVATYNDTNYTLVNLCTRTGGSCVSSFDGACQCLLSSILGQWNYDLETLEQDDNYLQTLNQYRSGSLQDLQSVLGNPVVNETSGLVVAAEAMSMSYFLRDRGMLMGGSVTDPINEAYEETVFLSVAESAPMNYTSIDTRYFATRSFADEFGGAITGDLLLVQVSYVIAFLFLGATLGKIRCGNGSRWTLALGALFTVGLATGAGFGLSSAFGLFFGPVHSLLPFILLGIGVDDAFVIVNAFNRERLVKRVDETDEDLVERSARALGRAGASITVTSLTDLVAFAISSSSALPALASFCAYASICIFFLWFFAATFFTACLVLDERRQRANRRECFCCSTRKRPLEEEEGGYQEDLISRYFRNYHGPAITSKIGKVLVLIIFGGLLGFGIYGSLNLTVEDTSRQFVPSNSYLTEYFDAADEFFPSQGIDVFFIVENTRDNDNNVSSLYADRVALANLEERLEGQSSSPPFIAEPNNDDAYRNVMAGLSNYLNTTGTSAIGGATLGSDGWPITEDDFFKTLLNYASFRGPGAIYANDVSLDSNDNNSVRAIRIASEYVRLVKEERGRIIDDADRQIAAMDATRDLVTTWNEEMSSTSNMTLVSDVTPYSEKFLVVEGFKIIQRELFLNVALAIAAVGVIVFFTVPSPVTAIIITLNVAACIFEILGFMFALGIVIDSVSVINIVLAVGLSVDYSAHVGHCFMTKGGNCKNKRAVEALADIGAAVLSGAISTFLAVVVLLFSSSYVFVILSRQFALTVALGIGHGLILLPVLLSLFGPKAFASHNDDDIAMRTKFEAGTMSDPETGNRSNSSNSKEEEDSDEPADNKDDVEMTG